MRGQPHPEPLTSIRVSATRRVSNLVGKVVWDSDMFSETFDDDPDSVRICEHFKTDHVLTCDGIQALADKLDVGATQLAEKQAQLIGASWLLWLSRMRSSIEAVARQVLLNGGTVLSIYHSQFIYVPF